MYPGRLPTARQIRISPTIRRWAPKETRWAASRGLFFDRFEDPLNVARAGAEIADAQIERDARQSQSTLTIAATSQYHLAFGEGRLTTHSRL